MLRRLVTNKKPLVIVTMVVALALTGLFLPAKKVSIEPFGMLSIESKITISIGYETAYASPDVPVYQELTEATADGLSVVVDKPAGTLDGDLLVAGMTTNGVTSLTPPAGWTEISQGSSGGKMTSGSWWKIASSELANYTFQTNPAETIYIFILRITGAHATAPVDVSAFAIGDDTTPTCPTVTTTVADTLVLRLFGADDNDIAVSDYPTGHTGITINQSGAGSNQCSGGAAWKAQVTASATDTASFTLEASEEWYATTIAIKPPAPDIANTPASKNFGTVYISTDYWSNGTAPNWTNGLDDAECLFEVTNNSGATANIDIRATNFLSVGDDWILTTDAPGENTVRLKAGPSGETPTEDDMVILTTTDSDPPFITGLGAGLSKKWELKMETPSSFTDGIEKQSTITLTATLS